MGTELIDFHKTILGVAMTDAQAEGYAQVEALASEVLDDPWQRSAAGRAAALLLEYPDRCWRGLSVRGVSEDGEDWVRMDLPAIETPDGWLPKEEMLAERLPTWKARTLVCVRSDAVARRLAEMLSEKGIGAGVLVSSRHRHQRQADIYEIRDAYDVMIARTAMVAAGLDFGGFNTVCMFEPETSNLKVVRALEQVILTGQMRDIAEVHLAYAGTDQTAAVSRNHWEPDFRVKWD